MCFSIPYKVLRVDETSALIEGGWVVKIGKELKVKKGDYLQVAGNIGVGILSKTEGLKVRQLIKSLNT